MKPWEKKEKKDAKFFGAKAQKGSGNQWSAPGDGKASNLLVESKHTDHRSFTITKELWEKIHDEALFMFRYPVLSIEIQDTELVIMEKCDFEKITKIVLGAVPSSSLPPQKE
jgi:hypothetical protein